MSENRPASERPTQGVYYARADYAGFWRRLMVDLIDFTLLLIIFVAITVASIFLPIGERALPHILFWSAIALGFVYLVLLKRSRVRTLGYIVGGVRVVNIQGEKPSIWALTTRALFAFFGPLNPILDALWIAGDERGQALRDKVAHTYVVRDRAEPVGHAPIIYSTYTILAVNFFFAEVRPEE